MRVLDRSSGKVVQTSSFDHTVNPSPTIPIQETTEQVMGGNRKVATIEAANSWGESNGQGIWDGDKFAGGFGDTYAEIFKDYYTLRARSNQLFTESGFASGLVDRITRMEIGTGLFPECTPMAESLGMDDDAADDWGDACERKFAAWGGLPFVCDIKAESTFAQMQQQIRRESLIEGDILVLLLQNPKTKLPYIQLISGSEVVDPLEAVLEGKKKIRHGVEIDKNGKQIAYYVRQEDDTETKRIAAFDDRGRPVAWLVYGIPKRVTEQRGTPLLAIILQSLKELDRYRDAVLRKAVVSSIFAMFVSKEQAGPGTKPLSGAATVLRDIEVTDNRDDAPSATRTVRKNKYVPGVTLEELNPGEKPQAFDSKGTDEKYGEFEEAILNGVSFAVGYPPDVLRQIYSSNYTAGMSANNDATLHILYTRSVFAGQFCQPVYTDWLISQALRRRIEAPGLLEAWRDPELFEIFAAWTLAAWYGPVKPSADPLKTIKAYKEAIEAGMISRRRAARELYGVDYSKQVKQLARDNAMLAEAMKPLVDQAIASAKLANPAEAEADTAAVTLTTANKIFEMIEDQLVEMIDNKLDEKAEPWR
jgi:lambda family phage portal protein